MHANYTSLIHKLDEFIRKYYKNQLLKGLIYSTALLLVSFIAVTLLESVAHFNSTIRTILFYLFLISSGFILG